MAPFIASWYKDHDRFQTRIVLPEFGSHTARIDRRTHELASDVTDHSLPRRLVSDDGRADHRGARLTVHHSGTVETI